jgi:hypothetical protein
MESENAASKQTNSNDDTLLEQLRSGQKLIIYAILVNFLGFLGTGKPLYVLAVSIVAVVLALVGFFRMAGGFQYSVGAKIALVVTQFIPLINIIVLIVLNTRATKLLRAAGFTVGLLGASRRAAAQLGAPADGPPASPPGRR